jgi:amino acid adenylation domain-containing protein
VSDLSKNILGLSPKQLTIQAKCFHPSATFVEFSEKEIDQSIPDRFEKMVRLYPERIAIKTRDRAVTYDTLNKAANRIGRAILEEIGPGSEPIALLLGNGIDLIAALIGVLKAGKFFVAIDPSFPLSRIMYMLRNTETRLIVTKNENWEMERRLVGYNCARLNIDEIGDRSLGENLDLAIPPNKIATIIYTSGSTAEPKGVVKTHAYCLERAEFYIRFLSAHPDDRLSLLHSISFGSGEINLHASLLSGASLHPFDVKSEGISRLVQWLNAEKITIFHCSPSLFRQFVDYIPKHHEFSDLRLIHLSGSAITRTNFDHYKKHFPPTTSLAFHMGATEAGCIACALVDHHFSFPQNGTPAGFTREQKKVLILDEEGQEVRPGGIGEIAVRSRYLAQEYWRNPELTKARFLPDPNGGGERIYLTGDLGQLLPNGFLIHLGRKDFMVKVRGYRVELGEVERTLLEHPEVKEAAVVAWEREAEETYLAAYLVSRTDVNLPVDQLAAFLKKKLPDYMIPSAFIFVDSLPLVNGKLNRRALPKPESRRPEFSRPYKPPETNLERTLVTIWAEVLGIDKVGIHDNFFDLGGHSLLATQVISRIRQECRVELPLRILFEQPTVADLALVIAATQAARAQQTDVSRILSEIESLAEDEANELIAQQGQAKKI